MVLDYIYSTCIAVGINKTSVQRFSFAGWTCY